MLVLEFGVCFPTSNVLSKIIWLIIMLLNFQISTIRIKKSDTFIDNKKLNNSNGVLDIELYLEYLDMYDNYDNNSIVTTLILQNGKIK